MFNKSKQNGQAGSAYDYSFENLKNDQKLSLSAYQGKVILIVNTASQCGFTPQYKALEQLYQNYKSQGLVIIGVPSNDFGHQEPGTNEEIAHFCEKNFRVTFPLVKKEIVSGEGAHDFYLWARQVLGFGTAPKWNFHKYLIDKNGHLVDYFSSFRKPDSPRLIKAIEELIENQSEYKSG